jgi:hypothetical protein
MILKRFYSEKLLKCMHLTQQRHRVVKLLKEGNSDEGELALKTIEYGSLFHHL